jgi:plasmid stability protein
MNLTIKDIPTELHGRLKARALANKRSLNWEVIDILEKAETTKPVDVAGLLEEVHRIHAHLNVPPLSEALLKQSIAEGRP